MVVLKEMLEKGQSRRVLLPNVTFLTLYWFILVSIISLLAFVLVLLSASISLDISDKAQNHNMNLTSLHHSQAPLLCHFQKNTQHRGRKSQNPEGLAGGRGLWGPGPGPPGLLLPCAERTPRMDQSTGWPVCSPCAQCPRNKRSCIPETNIMLNANCTWKEGEKERNKRSDKTKWRQRIDNTSPFWSEVDNKIYEVCKKEWSSEAGCF